jgi:glycine cleavage system aminomethyltransferase T
MDDVIVSRDQKYCCRLQREQSREADQAFSHGAARHGMDFDMADQTEGSVMVAIQGPKAIERIAGLLGRMSPPEAISLHQRLDHADQVHGVPQRLHRRRRS